MVKCIVCGAVFEDDIKICPVCGVGPENFVKAEEKKVDFSSNTSEIFMILGGGIAAVSAAEAIRMRNSECGICILTDEEYLPYNRPMLTKGMGGKIPENILIHEQKWYDDNNICVLTNKKVEKILPDKHEIIVNGDEVYYYDKCIYALGAKCFIPPIEGNDLYGVFAIRTLQDINRLAQFPNADITDAAVIGGGVLGLEAAWTLKQSGIDNVTVLEAAHKLMPRNLDDESSKKLEDICTQNGVKIIKNAKIKFIDGQQAVDGIVLDDGTKINARIVIISCGIKPNTEIAADCGIETARAVKVDSHCHTSIPNIFACGDCAQYRGINYALWAQAIDMGEVAGANAAGDSMDFEFKPYPLTFNGMNTSLFAVGDCITSSNTSCISEKKGDYDKRFYFFGKLCGAVLIGDTSAAKDIVLEV